MSIKGFTEISLISVTIQHSNRTPSRFINANFTIRGIAIDAKVKRIALFVADILILSSDPAQYMHALQDILLWFAYIFLQK